MKLYHGDCLEVMKGIADKSIDLLLTDIPYDGVNRKTNGLRNLDKGKADIITFDLSEFIAQSIRITKGSGYIFCGWGQISLISDLFIDAKASVRLGFWHKTNPSPMNGQNIYLSGIEPFIYFKFPKATYNAFCRTPVFNYPNGHSKIHPTEKPIKLFNELIEISSNKGDIVIDPCMGSGTTGIACKNLGREFIGIELDEKYFEIAKSRIENHKPEINLFN